MRGNLKRCCDLVMKGGITSGVVYPPAVKKIAERFYLVGIGGTSAGAIAASLTAAAEYRRRTTGSFEGFEALEDLAQDLAKPGKLLTLFRPDHSTAKLFGCFMKLKNERAGWWTKAQLTTSLITQFLFFRNRVLGQVIENGFGLCSGMANDNCTEDEATLTGWLAEKIDTVAGKTGAPLTFADLHEAPVPDGIRSLVGTGERSIDLRAVTTCLTFGRPFELPFESRIFAFDLEEWARLFPARILDHMVDACRKAKTSVDWQGKLPLPGNGLPVVVAARMSLSFPVLISMVPLYAVNYHREDQPLQRVWFSDGGITSNFPVHRFDSLYPAWPTLGINLQYTDKSGAAQRRKMGKDLVYLPRRGGILDLWHDFENREKPLGKLLGFASAVFRSAQTWHDNAFLRLPGYRDRLVEIWLTPQEGGMNLDMDKATVEDLIERGALAGEWIGDRFSRKATDSMSWEGHRWTRFRSGMAGLMETLRNFRTSVATPMEGDRSLDELLAGRKVPPCYRFASEKQRKAAAEVTEALLQLVEKIEAMDVCLRPDQAADSPFCAGPRPRAENGSRAPF